MVLVGGGTGLSWLSDCESVALSASGCEGSVSPPSLLGFSWEGVAGLGVAGGLVSGGFIGREGTGGARSMVGEDREERGVSMEGEISMDSGGASAAERSSAPVSEVSHPHTALPLPAASSGSGTNAQL